MSPREDAADALAWVADGVCRAAVRVTAGDFSGARWAHETALDCAHAVINIARGEYYFEGPARECGQLELFAGAA